MHEIEWEAAESLFHSHGGSAPDGSADDRLFERTWAETLLNSVLDQLAAAYEAQGNEDLFRSISMFLTIGAAPLPSYTELASRLSTSESTLRSHVTRLRARYRELLRAEVRRTVDSEAQIDGELHELLRVLGDS